MHSRASPLPQGICVDHKTNVGAGLLAKAIEQALRLENLAQEGLGPRILRCIEEFGR